MDINIFLNNTSNIYYGHGTGTEDKKIIDSIMKNGLRCSHGSLYFTTVALGIGKNINKESQKLIKNWPHKDSKIIIIVSIPQKYHILPSFSAGLGNKQAAAFNYIPSESQREENELTNSPYVMPEFIFGYYNAIEDKYYENPKYYEKLTIEEQLSLFDKVKKQYFYLIEEGYGIEEYKNLIKDLNGSYVMPLTDEEVDKYKIMFQKDKLLSQIDEEILNKNVKMPDGKIVKFEKYLKDYALNIIPLKDFIVLKSNNSLFPILHFIYENVLYDCQERYNGDITRYINENVVMDNTLKKDDLYNNDNKNLI